MRGTGAAPPPNDAVLAGERTRPPFDLVGAVFGSVLGADLQDGQDGQAEEDPGGQEDS